MTTSTASSITITAYKPGKKKPEYITLLRSIYGDGLQMEAQRVRLKMKRQGFQLKEEG